MKKSFLFSSLMCIGLMAQAQVKILFDATKAETAGNADWVIDADQHNISWNPNAGTGGSESNAQKIPTPAQSGITASTSETYWTGSLSSWGIALVKAGYTVETLPYNGQITYGSTTNAQDLSHYKVFIIDEPNILFTASQKTALIHFVQNGGGLFIISDHDQSDRNGDGNDSPGIWNDLLTNNSVASNPFGFTFDLQNYVETTTNFAQLPNDSVLHGPAGNPAQMKISNGTTMSLSLAANSTVVPLVYKLGVSNTAYSGVYMCRAHYGAGRVVALGDSSPPDDGTGDPNDNLYNGWSGEVNGDHASIIMNATIWLATDNQGTTGLSDAGAKTKGIVLYPNPVSGSLQFTGLPTNGTCTLEVYDTTGKQVLNTRVNENGTDAAMLETGLYFYVLRQNKDLLKTGKFSKLWN